MCSLETMWLGKGDQCRRRWVTTFHRQLEMGAARRQYHGQVGRTDVGGEPQAARALICHGASLVGQ